MEGELPGRYVTVKQINRQHAIVSEVEGPGLSHVEAAQHG